MRQVSTQEELQAALLAQEDEIQVIADFDVRAPQNVTHSLLLRSAPGAAAHTISKTAGFSGSLLRVSNGGALTLENLILDGAAAGSYLENPANRTLIQASGGSVRLTNGAVLQNNSSYQEGGGLYLSGDAAYVNTLLMDGDAVIRGCNSRTSGGGLTAALRNNGDSVRLAGTALIEQNTAANGAGVYLRAYLPEAGGALSIGEQVQIRNNQASGNGGGVYCSSFSTGGSAPLSLTIEGEAEISANQAASGGGIYFYSATPGDQLILTGAVRITGNIAAANGGGLYLSAPRDSVSLSIQGARIAENQALYGGGMFVRATAGGVLTVTGSTILSGNTATDAASSAGGGLWLQNVSGALTAMFANVSFVANRATGYGGGLFLSNSGAGDLQLSDISISRNTADTSGGGLYSVGSAGRIAIQGGSQLTQNQAASGGGIYHTGEGLLLLEAVTIDQNTADAGQGVYNAGALALGPVVHCRDGLYLLNQDAVPALAAHLAEGSVVQLEQSGHVTPNPDGFPILLARSDLQLTSADAAAFRAPALAGFTGWGFVLTQDGHDILLSPTEYTLQYANTLGAENPNPTHYTVLTPTITLLPLPDTRGDRFLGWFDAPEGGNPVTALAQGSTGDKTLFARWEAIIYTLTYCGNDAGGPPALHIPGSVSAEDGQSVVLSDIIPTREGFAFTGWNTRPGGDGTAYQPGETIADVYADIALYAQWLPLCPVVCTLTYCGNDAGGPPACCLPCPQQIPAGQYAEISCGMPCRAYYRFTGWSTDPCGKAQHICPGQTIGPVTADICLYAQWKLLLPPPCCSCHAESD